MCPRKRGSCGTTEAARLSEMVGQVQIETQHSVIRAWRDAHQGVGAVVEDDQPEKVDGWGTGGPL